MAMATQLFAGSNVFLSRNLVAPEVYDSVHDALRLNGARVFLLCDPSRAGPDDFHVISSPDHEKFEDLRARGCMLLGPQCILSCAKEHKVLPKRGYTCCLAMDGDKVLTSGFEKDEKITIEKLVTAMGGVLYSKVSSDVSFVIMKNVTAAKYKRAQNFLKKPIVTISWLHHCWSGHRLVPQEPYKIPPFTGLTVCATRIPADERKAMERLIVQNGGKYSPDLTKKCTHLVSDAPEGDKYIVARKWGHIHIVLPRWVDQCVARKACLDEDLFPVQGASVSSGTAVKSGLKRNPSEDDATITSHSVVSTVRAPHGTPLSPTTCSAFSDSTVFTREGSETLSFPNKDEKTNIVGCVAADSQDEDNDLYLSDCRIFFVGFQVNELRDLIKLVRKGGATRHMSLSEKLTHIIVGSPSEMEWRELRQYAAWGVIKVVKTLWLEDCVRAKKEIPVSARHIVHDLFSEKGPVENGMRHDKNLVSSTSNGQAFADTDSEAIPPIDGRTKSHSNLAASMEVAAKFQQEKLTNFVNKYLKCEPSKKCSSSINRSGGKTLNVFQGHMFRFSDTFPKDRRAEVVESIVQGGGVMVDDDQEIENVHFIIQRHGFISHSEDVSNCTIVSSHWVCFCLEEGCMLDVQSHILYSPLQCHVPLPGFGAYRFCISQYNEKDRLLLRNLCFVLGAKFTDKLTKKVTHLLCKFTSGPKYEAACTWGIESVTAEWITQCIMQDKVIDMAMYRPKPVTEQDRENGACTMSQFPTQAASLASGDVPSQLVSQSQCPSQVLKHRNVIGGINSNNNVGHFSPSSKKPKHITKDSSEGLLRSKEQTHQDKMDHAENRLMEDFDDTLHGVADVASAIEDLLEQSSKIQEMNPPICDQSIFSPGHISIGQDRAGFRSAHGVSNHWLRSEKKDIPCNTRGQEEIRCPYDGFSETQESQVVGYEEDLSGRQMIIDRVRTQSRV